MPESLVLSPLGAGLHQPAAHSQPSGVLIHDQPHQLGEWGRFQGHLACNMGPADNRTAQVSDKHPTILSAEEASEPICDRLRVDRIAELPGQICDGDGICGISSANSHIVHVAPMLRCVL